MKKALVFHHCGYLGGGLLSCFDLIDMLSKDYDVYLAIANPTEGIAQLLNSLDIKEQYNLTGFPTLTYHNAEHNTLKTILKYFASLKYIDDWVSVAKRVQPDIVILNSSALVPLIKPLKSAGFKTMCIVRETMYSDKGLLINRLIRKKLSGADAVAYLTGYDLEQWSVKGVRQFVLPDVVNERFFKITEEATPESKEFTILYMGGLSLAKGIETLVDAYELMSANVKTRLVILGWGSFVTAKKGLVGKLFYSGDTKRVVAVQNKIQAFSQENKVIELPGVVNDTAPYYKKADVVVFPVLEVHQPRPAYEAGFYKKPVILPDCPNFKENIDDGYNGLYYEPRNPQALAEKLQLLSEHRAFAVELGENNFVCTREKHSLCAVAQILKQELEAVIEEVK